MPTRVERTDPDGVDYGWVMQTTFILTILVGAPAIALLSVPLTLPTWGARAAFAVRVGAVVWLLVGATVYVYARRTGAGDGTPAKGADRSHRSDEEG